MSRKNANKRVFDFLKKAGDSINEKREVTHWFYFEKFEDAERFEKYANDIGFYTITKQHKAPEYSDNLLLLLGHFEGLNEDQIDFDTMEFFEIAPKYNGIYDGWETSFKSEGDDFINKLKEE